MAKPPQEIALEAAVNQAELAVKEAETALNIAISSCMRAKRRNELAAELLTAKQNLAKAQAKIESKQEHSVR